MLDNNIVRMNYSQQPHSNSTKWKQSKLESDTCIRKVQPRVLGGLKYSFMESWKIFRNESKHISQKNKYHDEEISPVCWLRQAIVLAHSVIIRSHWGFVLLAFTLKETERKYKTMFYWKVEWSWRKNRAWTYGRWIWLTMDLNAGTTLETWTRKKKRRLRFNSKD